MHIVDDLQNAEGQWIRSYYLEGVRYTTKGDVIYKNMLARCKPSGCYQKKFPTYAGVTCDFASFQEYMDWATKQIGFGRQHYVLDKDILFKGNKRYAPDTCLFVPRELNSLWTKADAIRGQYPVGVCWDNEKQKFWSAVWTGQRRTRCGLFDTVAEAFAAYKQVKEVYAQTLAEKHKHAIDPRAYAALLNYRVEITD